VNSAWTHVPGVLRHWHFTTALRYVAEGRHVEYATLRDFSQAFRQQQLNAGMTVDLGRQ
jgi:thioredoxin-related protein